LTPCNPNSSRTAARLALLAPVVVVLALGATSAFAGTTGTEFQTMYTTMLNWATGYPGTAIAVAAIFLGAGIGVARSSPTPGARGLGLRALHGLRADHHRLDHDGHGLRARPS
jgi:conjugal transfer pilus assembly protein TraA